MMHLKELLGDADKKGYAIPAFNYTDIWELMAIIEAAQEAHAPVICQSHMRVVNTFSAGWLGGLGQAAMEQAAVPVVNHLDHSSSVTLCMKAIDCRYPSVMYDGSSLSLEENIKNTRQTVNYGKEHGDACVEGEVGRIKGASSEGSYSGGDFLVRVEDAVRMAEETGVTSLAIGLGNAHGFYAEAPKLDFERLKQVNQAVSTPLVLHGGTGIPDQDIRCAIENGINKVNVGTDLHAAYIRGLKGALGALSVKEDLLALMLPAKDAVKAVVKRWIYLCMADGRF